MQQPPPPMMNMMPPFPPTNITTEQIQKYLDENKKLIMAILDNQNLGKLAECAQYQVQLQKNLMYLAAIADAQPQAPTMPPQMPPHPAMQQGGHYMQHPQAAAMAQQSIGFPPKMPPVQFNPQQIQEQQQQLQQQQAIQAHMGMRSGVNNGRHAMHTETTLGGGGSGGPPSTAAATEFSRGGGGGTSSTSLDARGSKQDGMEGGSGDGQGNSAAGPNSGNGEPSYLKGSEEAK